MTGGPTFKEVYEEQFRFVWRSLRRLGVRESDVADAAQDVFLVVHRRLDEFEGRSKVSTWLYGICYRVARDRRRLASDLRPTNMTKILFINPNSREVTARNASLNGVLPPFHCLVQPV